MSTGLNSRRAMRTLESAGKGSLGRDALVAAIRQSPPGRREFLVCQVKELERMQKLKGSLEHHIRNLKKERVEIAGRAQVRVSGSAFQKVTVQIAEVYQTLDEEVRGVVFRLNQDAGKIAQKLVS